MFVEGERNVFAGVSGGFALTEDENDIPKTAMHNNLIEFKPDSSKNSNDPVSSLALPR